MSLLNRDVRIDNLSEKNNQLRKDAALLVREVSALKTDNSILTKDKEQLTKELKIARERATTIAKQKTAEYEITIEDLRGNLRREVLKNINQAKSIDDQLKIKTNEMQIRIDLLKAELEAKESISKQKHEIEIEKLKAKLEIAFSEIELHKQQYKGTAQFTNQLLNTVQIIGAASAKADAKNAKGLIEITNKKG